VLTSFALTTGSTQLPLPWPGPHQLAAAMAEEAADEEMEQLRQKNIKALLDNK
jgi:hypothetical protein